MELDLARLVITATGTSTGTGVNIVTDLAATAQQEIYNYLVQTKMFVAAGAIYILPQLLRRVPSIKKAMENQWVVRFMPLYPLLASLILVLMPGALNLPDRQSGTMFIAIVWLAFWSQMAHKFIGQSIMGDDDRITTLAVKSRSQVEIKAEPQTESQEK